MNTDQKPLIWGIQADLVIPAFAAALASVEHVAKTQTANTGKYSYSYADLGDVANEVKRACSMFGLSLTQNPSAMEGPGGAIMLSIQTTVFHIESGQWLSFPPMIVRMPPDMQAYGSALTYARRYALLTIFGIAPEDDDGRTATDQVRRQVSDGNRTEAEARIREELRGMEPEFRKAAIAAFRDQFGSGLSELDSSRHGEALGWLMDYIAQPATDPVEDAE